MSPSPNSRRCTLHLSSPLHAVGLPLHTGVSITTGLPLHTGVSIATGLPLHTGVSIATGLPLHTGVSIATGLPLHTGVSIATGLPLHTGVSIATGLPLHTGVSTLAPYHQESWFSGRCKRLRKAKTNMALTFINCLKTHLLKSSIHIVVCK